jgi:hypothetical protein
LDYKGPPSIGVLWTNPSEGGALEPESLKKLSGFIFSGLYHLIEKRKSAIGRL